jgi:hypothetical protein
MSVNKSGQPSFHSCLPPLDPLPISYQIKILKYTRYNTLNQLQELDLWRCRKNAEPCTVECIKMRWTEHIARMWELGDSGFLS